LMIVELPCSRAYACVFWVLCRYRLGR